MGGLTKMMGDVDAEGDMRRLVGIIDAMTPEERRTSGSGVMIRSDGYLVTNEHVVADDDLPHGPLAGLDRAVPRHSAEFRP